MMIQVFALESALLRARKLRTRGLPWPGPPPSLVRLFAAQAMEIVEMASRRIVAAVAEGDTLRVQLAISSPLSSAFPKTSTPSRATSPNTWWNTESGPNSAKANSCLPSANSDST